jgi:uncharacterized protein (UPF0276 family)
LVKQIDTKISGSGVGLRNQHLDCVLEHNPKINWFECHSENFFDYGIQTEKLEEISKLYPLSLHGVGLSLGSTDELNKTHLDKLKSAIDRFKPQLISEHLSWGSVDGNFFNDLLPMPYTGASLQLFADKVKQTQDAIGTQILIENPSSYLEFKDSTISEWDFYSQLPNLSGCGLLLDLNNIFVSSKNHKFNTQDYLSAINKEDIQEMHLAGFSVNNYEKGSILIDDHGSKVKDEVWDLYKNAVDKFGKKPTLIEWDTNIPEFEVLQSEAQKIQRILDE